MAMTWRTSDELLDRVRRQAQQWGRSLSDWVTAVLSATTDPALAGDEAQRVRQRLATAGLLEGVEPTTHAGPAEATSFVLGQPPDAALRSPVWWQTDVVDGFQRLLALVKLYVDEDGADVVRPVSVHVVSAIARVEVPAVLRRKSRSGDLPVEDASVLVAVFVADSARPGRPLRPRRTAEPGPGPGCAVGRYARTARVRRRPAALRADACRGWRTSTCSCASTAPLGGGGRV
jgi:hypothetical protein